MIVCQCVSWMHIRNPFGANAPKTSTWNKLEVLECNVHARGWHCEERGSTGGRCCCGTFRIPLAHMASTQEKTQLDKTCAALHMRHLWGWGSINEKSLYIVLIWTEFANIHIKLQLLRMSDVKYIQSSHLSLKPGLLLSQHQVRWPTITLQRNTSHCTQLMDFSHVQTRQDFEEIFICSFLAEAGEREKTLNMCASSAKSLSLEHTYLYKPRKVVAAMVTAAAT